MCVLCFNEFYSVQTEHIQMLTIFVPDPSNQIPTEYLISLWLLVGSHKLTRKVPTRESQKDEFL